MKQSAENYKRIVIKIGSSLFYRGKKLDFSLLRAIVREISCLVKSGREVVIVSSGAIAIGMNAMKLSARPKELAALQAAAAVGQPSLMNKFNEYFSRNKMNCGQVLLTWDDFANRKRYLNAKNTLLALLKSGCVPVINENDTISADEIKFGDNDRLSALVAGIVDADLLIMLSDVDGLLMRDKKTLVCRVDEITQDIRSLAQPSDRCTSVGGMITKIDAAKICVDSGLLCIIANGRKKSVITQAANNPLSTGSWTVFLPKKISLAARQRWIAFGAKPRGKIIVDEGAKKALAGNKSLLSVGVSAAEGNFACGEVVSIIDKSGNEFARGKACLSCQQVDKVKGIRTAKEVIHCDNIVIL